MQLFQGFALSPDVCMSSGRAVLVTQPRRRGAAALSPQLRRKQDALDESGFTRFCLAPEFFSHLSIVYLYLEMNWDMLHIFLSVNVGTVRRNINKQSACNRYEYDQLLLLWNKYILKSAMQSSIILCHMQFSFPVSQLYFRDDFR